MKLSTSFLALSDVASACRTTERPIHCVRVICDKTCRAYATDGHILLRLTGRDGGTPGELLIPRSEIARVRPHLQRGDEVTARSEGSVLNLVIRSAGLTSRFTSPLVTGTFPECDSLLKMAKMAQKEQKGDVAFSPGLLWRLTSALVAIVGQDTVRSRWQFNETPKASYVCIDRDLPDDLVSIEGAFMPVSI